MRSSSTVPNRNSVGPVPAHAAASRESRPGKWTNAILMRRAARLPSYGSPVHRQRTQLAARIPGRARPVAQAVERSAIVATYRLHDRMLSNRSSRALYADDPPQLDALQQRVVEELDADGYA